MRNRLRVLLILLALGPSLLAWAGCESSTKPPTTKRNQKPLQEDARRVLDAAERLVLFSIEGEGDGVPESTDTSFHGFKILGKTEIANPPERQQLLSALYQGIDEANDGGALCFVPRHGIRAAVGDETVDLVICFECSHFKVFGKQKTLSLTSSSPASAFNAALGRAGVPLAKPPGIQH